MPVTTDILATYRRPAAVMRRFLAGDPREERAFAVLIGACGLGFVAQWPRLARAAYENPEVPLDARLGGALVAQMFVLPLLAYAIAAITHFVARALGGRSTAYGARLALFWALLAVSPLMLFHGLVLGFIGPGPEGIWVGVIVGSVFLVFWATMLREALR